MSIIQGTFFFSLGTALLLLAYRFHLATDVRNVALFRKHPFFKEVAVIFVVFFGLWLVVNTAALCVAQNKGAVLALLGIAGKGQGEGGLSTAIAVLGIVMALVTAVVFTVSKDAVDRLDKEKQQMAKRYSGIEEEASELRLLNVRLYAYQENELELRNARVNSDYKTQSFRTFLSVMYRRTEGEKLLELLSELEKKLSVHGELELLPIDRRYLDKVRDHYRRYSTLENATDVANAADRILRRR